MTLRIASSPLARASTLIVHDALRIGRPAASGARGQVFEKLLGDKVAHIDNEEMLARAVAAVVAWPVIEAREVEPMISAEGARRQLVAARVAPARSDTAPDDVTLSIEVVDSGRVNISASSANERVLERVLDARDDLARSLSQRGLVLNDLTVGKPQSERRVEAECDPIVRGQMRSVYQGQGFWEVTI